MYLYCDTSALVKLYVDESHASALRELAERAQAISTCRVSWAEAHATFSRRIRELPADSGIIDQARRLLAEDWPQMILIEVSQQLLERAGEFSDTFALRGYDSVQLAAARELAVRLEEPLVFACFDQRLNKAASVLGMHAPFLNR